MGGVAPSCPAASLFNSVTRVPETALDHLHISRDARLDFQSRWSCQYRNRYSCRRTKRYMFSIQAPSLSPAPSPPPHWEGSASHRGHLFTSTHRFGQPPGFCASTTTAQPPHGLARTRTSEQGPRRPPLFKSQSARIAAAGRPHPITPQTSQPGSVLAGGQAALSLCARGSRSGAALWSRSGTTSQSEPRTQHAGRTKRTPP